MARGRKGKPTNLKLVQGNPGKRKIATGEPQPEVLFMAPPAHLDKIAQACWSVLMPDLVKWGLFTKLDSGAFEAYCAAYSQWRRASKSLGKALTYKSEGRNGTMRRARPEIAIINAALKVMSAWGSEFGLSPSARIRIKGAAQGDLFDPYATDKEQAARNPFDEI